MTARVSLPRRLLAEGLGTAILVATVVGSGIMAERLSGGNQAIALLGSAEALPAPNRVGHWKFRSELGNHFGVVQ